MGGTTGHVAMGLAYSIIGLWHLFNSIKLHALHPKSFLTRPWFPVPRLRHLEPFTIILVTTIFSSMELSIGRGPLTSTKKLPHTEHVIIALSFFVYASFAIVLDRAHGRPSSPTDNGLVHFLQALSFGLQLLVLHLHSTDHAGLEGHYHWLLQLVTFASLAGTLLAIAWPGSFVNSFVRAFSVVFQGVWLMVTGVLLWSPGMLPEGCFLKAQPGRVAVLCHGDRALDRAKALVNIQFGLCLILWAVLAVSFYVGMVKYCYRREGVVEYDFLGKVEETTDEGDLGDKQRCKSRNNSLSLPAAAAV
ncbi:Family of unknown function (DUF716 [Striga hermonthica]|uniref:Uncharacterized protein n=1 Tax=Striga hermonthica TaxID=68872 RepID=A0A9N7MPU7_STRHE|nr:Family of unknown function (DUF716 [Striga hermonthica]